MTLKNASIIIPYKNLRTKFLICIEQVYALEYGTVRVTFDTNIILQYPCCDEIVRKIRHSANYTFKRQSFWTVHKTSRMFQYKNKNIEFMWDNVRKKVIGAEGTPDTEKNFDMLTKSPLPPPPPSQRTASGTSKHYASLRTSTHLVGKTGSETWF